MSDLIVWIWLGGWAAATVVAAFIGGTDEGEDLPLFCWPLFFGWFWPAVVGLMIVMGALGLVARLGDLTRKGTPS